MENEISEKNQKTETEKESVLVSDESSNDEQSSQDPTIEEIPAKEGSSETFRTDPTLDADYSDIQTVLPIEIREHTPFVTEAGDINVIHEVTLGDLLVSTVLMAILIFQVMTTFFRRY